MPKSPGMSLAAVSQPMFCTKAMRAQLSCQVHLSLPVDQRVGHHFAGIPVQVREMAKRMRDGHVPTAADLEAALAPVKRTLRMHDSDGVAGLSDEEVEVIQFMIALPAGPINRTCSMHLPLSRGQSVLHIQWQLCRQGCTPVPEDCPFSTCTASA